MNTPAYNLAPMAAMALLGAVLALGPFLWVWFRQRNAGMQGRMRALTVLTLFLTFDLVLFGAFTRLTDSGLGCPDWPGCYGHTSPLGATVPISQAQEALPSGPVTHSKAWVEMTHRYLATGVGALITLLAVMSWVEARRQRASLSPWLSTLTLAWVCLQGAFGALTVTMKLYPAIVTAHLLAAMVLLVLLALQAEAYRPAPTQLPPSLSTGLVVVALLTCIQVALGGWVSTNYAVLACGDFPTCQGQWWPAMDFEQGFTLLRHLGVTQSGAYLSFEALTAIHYSHRLMAYGVLCALALLAWRLRVSGVPAQRRWSLAVAGVALWQLFTGLGNVLLGWPLGVAVAHTGGAAALVTMLAVLIARAHGSRFAAATAAAKPVQRLRAASQIQTTP